VLRGEDRPAHWGNAEKKDGTMEARIRTIVVGVAAMQAEDPKLAPRGEESVLAPAVELARRLGATLHVVQVLDARDPVLSAYTHALQGGAALEQRCREVQQRLTEQERRFSSAAIHCHALEGSPDRDLCRLASELDADLLIVGATRRGWVWRNVLGSTAERVLKRSSVPVLILRRPFPETANRVLFTTDLSSASRAVLESGAEVVRALCGPEQVELRSLLACGYSSTMLQHLPAEIMMADASKKLRRFLGELETGGQRIEPRLRMGNPSQQIVREAADWHADLLVLGTHSRFGVARWLLGSTAEATLRATSCNALVIPTRVATTRRQEPGGGSSTPERSYPGTEEHPESDPPEPVTA
jgi:nucleotide-binding universal stress UspA family protein